MMSGNPPNVALHYHVYSFASDVMEFAAHHLSEMVKGSDKDIFNEWRENEWIEFYDLFLKHMTKTYKMHIRELRKKREDKNG